MLTLTYFPIAMYYLKTLSLVHHEISYTNILLRSQSQDKGDGSQLKQDKRCEIMNELGLSDIESLQEKLGCHEGLLIDFDYVSLLDSGTTMGQVDASDVNESLGKSQGRIQSSSQVSSSQVSSSQVSSNQVSGSQVSGSQVSGQWSSQGKSKEDFEVIDKDSEDNSKTVIQPFNKNFPGMRTLS